MSCTLAPRITRAGRSCRAQRRRAGTHTRVGRADTSLSGRVRCTSASAAQSSRAAMPRLNCTRVRAAGLRRSDRGTFYSCTAIIPIQRRAAVSPSQQLRARVRLRTVETAERGRRRPFPTITITDTPATSFVHWVTCSTHTRDTRAVVQKAKRKKKMSLGIQLCTADTYFNPGTHIPNFWRRKRETASLES